MNIETDPQILAKAQSWLSVNFDSETQKEVMDMIENRPTDLVEAFYRDLEFGTGGLRGIMGVGTNRMNKYTVGMATQGLANYLNSQFPNEQIKLAIAYDCRNNNTFFADVTSSVLSANGIHVYLFDALRPTPELSFAIRHLKCHSGIVITASHNPKEYNGYKVYWNDGGQLVNPHDENVITEVRKITDIKDVKFNKNESLITMIGSEIDQAYMKMINDLSLSPELIQKHKDIKIVFTPLHGTGVKLVPETLKMFGFENVISVDEQNVNDGNFPTVKSPNPEEPAALEMAIAKANASDATLVMATDPDADRVGIAVRNNKGEFVLMNGNQTASILFYYILRKWKENGKLDGNQFIVKTIVTSELLIEIAEKFGVKHYDVLTGFKYIADIILQQEGKSKFIVGGEESYGYLVGDSVRDKDAVASCCFIAEAAAWAAEQDKTIYDLLAEIYVEFGFYLESLKSLTKHGKSGSEEIEKMMADYRSNPPKSIAGLEVVMMKDYKVRKSYHFKNNTETEINLPKSNVLQFFTEDGSKITIRPSGTEPKIKFYFGVKGTLNSVDEFDNTTYELKSKLDLIIKDLGI